jgi:hypothetical protein
MTTLHKAPNPSLKNRPLAKLLKGCTFSGQRLADLASHKLLPDWLALSEIAELFDSDDMETLIEFCLDKELAYEGKLYGPFTDETLKGVITYQLPEGQYSRRADYCAINKDEFKRFLLSQGQWPVAGLLANWWPDEIPIDEIQTVAKSKNQQRDDDFINWKESTKLNLDAMTKEEIHQELIKRNPTLWTSGFNDWVRVTKLYEGKPGRKKG